MKETLTFRAWGGQLKKLFLLWLALAVLAGAVVVGAHFFTLPGRANAVALVSFGFEGIENGQDPNGNWFDATDIRDESVLTAAAEAAGLTLAEGEAEKIAANLQIEGVIPDDVITRITTLTSAYTSDTVPAASVKKIRAYYPTTYTLTLNVGALGYDRAAGNRLLRAVLDAYRDYFQRKYGYNEVFESAILNADYDSRDYDGAVALLRANLEALRRYVDALAAGDDTGFRSSETGLTFQDLTAGITALEDRDITALASYIEANAVTRDPQKRKTGLTWRKEEAERAGKALEDRLGGANTGMNGLIANYQKAVYLVPGWVSPGAGSDQDAPDRSAPVVPMSDAVEAAAAVSAYQVTQSSKMYDYLVRQRTALQKEKAETDALVGSLESRLAGADAVPDAGVTSYVESEFTRIRERISALLSSVRATAEDYNRSLRLTRAFQVLEFTEAKAFPFMELISASLADGMAVEALLLGAYLLLAALLAGRAGKGTKKNAPVPDGAV